MKSWELGGKNKENVCECSSGIIATLNVSIIFFLHVLVLWTFHFFSLTCIQKRENDSSCSAFCHETVLIHTCAGYCHSRSCSQCTAATLIQSHWESHHVVDLRSSEKYRHCGDAADTPRDRHVQYCSLAAIVIISILLSFILRTLQNPSLYLHYSIHSNLLHWSSVRHLVTIVYETPSNRNIIISNLHDLLTSFITCLII